MYFTGNHILTNWIRLWEKFWIFCGPRVNSVHTHEDICLIFFCLYFCLKYIKLLLRMLPLLLNLLYSLWLFGSFHTNNLDPNCKIHHYSVMMSLCCERCHPSVLSPPVFVIPRSHELPSSPLILLIPTRGPSSSKFLSLFAGASIVTVDNSSTVCLAGRYD